MVTDLNELIALCDTELCERQYRIEYYGRIKNNWEKLRCWMESNELTEFDKEVANRYLDETIGTHILPRNSDATTKELLRSVRMLVTYQSDGTFEFRSPSVEYLFEGVFGEDVLDYLSYCEDVQHLSRSTLEAKRLYLHRFCIYMNDHLCEYEELSIEYIEAFFKSMGYTLAQRHNAASTIRLFLRYVFDVGRSKIDCSIFVLPDNYKKNCKLPTTYEEEEIKSMIASVERASPIGKRDYLVLLLVSEYGWRAKDVTSFCFDDIDWDTNTIRFDQSKTGLPVEYPLIASVGNAIIDYLKYARPKTDVPQIIVSMENANKGKPLSSPTIHSIVTRYLRQANIKDWDKKKHGPHAMRHSLATNLLKKNVALPIISTVMGHQTTETTTVYISVDYDKLKQCALPMPPLNSPYYKKEDMDA